jgi:5-methyltetrahydropteroyltriglutamate--homocysteine methyltransferase
LHRSRCRYSLTDIGDREVWWKLDKANIDSKAGLGAEWWLYEAIFSALAASRIDQVSIECAGSRVPIELLDLLSGKDVLPGAVDVARERVETAEEVAAAIDKLRALAAGAALVRNRGARP